MESFPEMLGNSPAMEALREQLRRLATWRDAGRRLPAVLLHGETGTGKGLLARLIHQTGPRRLGPFVDVNCAAIPEPLLEAELFGFERGAFTDARRAKPGLFQTAHRGVLFLDEVALLPEPLQAKLLKVLEDQSVRRLGATHPEPADVWVISATNADLAAAIRARHFRDDLYHRLAVLSLTLPPLRARGDDALVLAQVFLERACADYGLPPKTLSPQARQRLRSYAWPGNVRELANVMERTALLADDPEVSAEALALDAAGPVWSSTPPEPVPLEDAIRQHLLAALEQTGWNISRTATALGISRNTVRARIERFGLKTGLPAPAAVRARREAPRPAAAAEAPVRWERRRVTLMRVVVLDAADPEHWPDTSRSLDIVIDKIHSFGGRVDEVSPRTVEASLGLSAIEDAPRRAVHAAMAVIKAGARADRPGRDAFAAGVAIHTAQVLVSQVGGALQLDRDAKREASSVLEALAAAAGPGEILVSPGAAPFLERRFELLPFAGDTTAVVGYRLAGTERRGLGPRGRISPFVGRASDLELLRSRLASAVRGRGQVVAVVGDAGVGKSRLVWELLHGEGLSDWLTLETGCTSYGAGTPYLPIVQLVRTYCRIAPDDGPGEAAARIAERLRALGAGLEAYAPPLLALLDLPAEEPEWLGLEPAQRRQRTLDAIKRVLVRESQIQPVLLVAEDLHWVDSETQALLDTLVESLPAARFMLLVSSRPEYQHGWGTRSYYTHLRVQPLPPQNTEELLGTLLGADESLRPLVTRLIEWTEGNPFFLEESVQALVETGAIVGAPGAYRLAAGPPPVAPVPATVEELLAARIGRLSAEARSLLQSAAAIGKDFPLPLLTAAAELPEPALRASLAQLQAGEFVYEASIGLKAEYTFKHALTHQVTYESLLPERRRALHARILAALETLGHESAEQVDRLADHAVRGEVWDRAVDYLTQAGHRALARSASGDADACFARALGVMARLPQGADRLRRAIDLRFDRRSALLPVADLDRILSILQEAEPLAVELGDPHRLGQLLVYMTGQRYLMGAYDDALEYGHRALAITESGRDFNLSISTHSYLGQVHHARGEYRRAAQSFKRNVDALVGPMVHERFGLPQLPSVHSRTCLVWSLAELGEFEEGVARGQEAIEIAEAVDQPLSLTVALAGLGVLHVRRGDLTRAVPILERAAELSQAWNIPLWFPRVVSALGVAHALAGRHAEALPLLEAAVEQGSAMHLEGGHSRLLNCLAEGHLLAGRTDRALEVGAQALGLARRHRERGYEAWALRLSAEALRLSAPQRRDEARGRVQDALQLAESLGMLPLRAHCQLELGRAAREAGAHDDARGALEAAREAFARLGMTLYGSLAEGELGAV